MLIWLIDSLHSVKIVEYCRFILNLHFLNSSTFSAVISFLFFLGYLVTVLIAKKPDSHFYFLISLCSMPFQM